MFSEVVVKNWKSREWTPGSSCYWNQDRVFVYGGNQLSVLRVQNPTSEVKTSLSSPRLSQTSTKNPEMSRVGNFSGTWPRSYHSCNLISNTLLIFGGHQARRYYSSLEVFDLASERWLQMKDPRRQPVPRSQHLALSWNDTTLAVIGGRYLGRPLSDSYLFDFRASRWDVRSFAMPSGRFAISGGVWKDKIWCWGGTDGRNNFDELLIWDPRMSKWLSEPLSGPLGKVQSSIQMGSMLVVGTDQGLWSLDLRSKKWLTLSSAVEGCMCSNSEDLLVMGKKVQICDVFQFQRTLRKAYKAKKEDSAKTSDDYDLVPDAEAPLVPEDDYTSYFSSSEETSTEEDSDEFLMVESLPPELPPRDDPNGGSQREIPLLDLSSSTYESGEMVSSSREVRELRRQLDEQEILLKVQQQRNEQLRARILELQTEKQVSGETEELSILTQKNQRILELEQEIETWMIESAKLRRVGEEAMTDINQRYESLQADFDRLQARYNDELQHRQTLEQDLQIYEEKFPQLEALIQKLEAGKL